MFSPVVQVPTVGPVQPHVCSGAVGVVTDWPLRHAHTGSLIAFVFLHYQNLSNKEENGVRIYNYQQLFNLYMYMPAKNSMKVKTGE